MRVTKYYSRSNVEENPLHEITNTISAEECIRDLFNHINNYNKGKIIQVNKITVQDYDGEYNGMEGAKLVTVGVDLDVTEEHIIIGGTEGK